MELKCFILYFTFNSSRLLLIAPLMELKYNNLNCRLNQSRLLIAPLMELKYLNKILNRSRQFTLLIAPLMELK